MCRIAALITFIAIQSSTLAQAYPTPLTKEECAQRQDTTWDESQNKCVYKDGHSVAKEECEQLSSAIWDESRGKCKRQGTLDN